MSQQEARVLKQGVGFIDVQVIDKSACQSCGAKQGCGVGSLSRLFGQRQKPLRLPTQKSYATGQLLILQLDDAALIWSAVLQYLMPLLLMMFSALVLTGLGVGDVSVSLFSLVSLFLGLTLSRWLAQHWLKHRFSIRITESLL